MPLPLPSLDTRRWSDLVAEGRALIPRYAPTWTDHNVHDPGIMLMELFAWLSEQLVYRANRIPERHLRKFLALAGFTPHPPQPALAVLGATLPPATGPLVVAPGVVFHADAASISGQLAFRVIQPVTLAQATIVTVQGFDGTRFTDHTRAWRDGVAITPLGIDPRAPSPYVADSAPALYLGFDLAIPAGDELHLFIWGDGSGFATRRRLSAEVQDRASDCVPPRACPPCEQPRWPCVDANGGPSPAPPNQAPRPWESALRLHHSVRVVWEIATAAGWEPVMVQGYVLDETRGLTLDGSVRLTIGGVMVARAIGVVADPRFYLRCRLVSGRFDAMPTLGTVVPNAIIAEQRLPVWRRYTIPSTATISGLPIVGQRQPLELTFDANGHIAAIAVAAAPTQTPDVHVLEFTPPAGPVIGILTLELERIAPGLGFPNQQVVVSGAPVVADTLLVRTHEAVLSGTMTRRWHARDDLDSATPTDAAVAVEHATGTLTFGTGVRGRLVPQGAPITASYELTRGAAGNVAAARMWTLPDEPINRAVAGASFAILSTVSLGNARAALLGADAEDVGDALERAAAFFWSHERLVELADSARQETLDQIKPSRVLALEAPQRATTTLDYERIVRDVPGTRIVRARAFASFDPRVPCYNAPGTVTVVVVPYLPADRPSPSPGLITAVRRYLERRRILTTRLVVVGPSYVDVQVTAQVRALESADPDRVQQDIVQALNEFLHPLRGGPNSLGWPFGRDVYRSEILATIDAVDGVDHVLSASLSAQRDGVTDDSQCGNVCVPPTYLVASLPHAIEVVTA